MKKREDEEMDEVNEDLARFERYKKDMNLTLDNPIPLIYVVLLL